MTGLWQRMFSLLLIGVLLESPSVSHAQAEQSATAASAREFEQTVGPLLARRCSSCHAGEELKGKLDISTREKILAGGESGPSVVAGDAAKSLVWQRVSADEMPPKHPLSENEKAVLKKWINEGANWSGGPLDPLAVSSEHRAGRDWWSLQQLKRVEIPRTAGPTRSPVDSFVLAKLLERGMSPSVEAERRTLIRRVSFDLIGLPPTPDEVDEFVSDPAPDAYERLMDRLLSSPHYGERWARHWLDVVRFGESNGFERDLPRPNAWHYRNWVIDALNADLPYDEFVRKQLAADIQTPDDAESLKAVGFLVAGAHDTVVPVVDRMRAMMRQDELEDTVGTVGQTFLGLTVNCARCHDHKFDPISAREYYQIASALAGVDHGERDIVVPEVTRQLNEIKSRIGSISKQIQEQEAPIREKVLAERANRSGDNIKPAPTPYAAWDFSKGLNDQIGSMHAKLHGSAMLDANGLNVDGSSFASTAPLDKDLVEKTLEVKVRLKSLEQRGGGAISLQTTDGQTFDAIVFGENEPRRWMAGSNGFVRTLPFEATDETQAEKELVVFAQVYRADGTITGYRNGQPYGKPIKKSDVVRYELGMSQIVFGLRHGTEAGGNRMLNGVIASARLYDKALSQEEVANSAGSANTFVTEAEIAMRLTPQEREERTARQTELNAMRLKQADLSKSGQFKIYTAIATQPPPMKVHKRGSVTALGEEVAPAGLSAINGLDANFGLKPNAIESHRRVALANWITNTNNPLFARVMTNRVWHYHFGAGLVETPSDLGFNGGLPSHPELLEWLSAEFSGKAFSTHPTTPSAWSLKRLHRLIATSATYRQASTLNEAATKVDAGNRLLWRMNPRRLEAESVRDAMLAVAGQLNNELGGKGYSDTNSYFFKGTQFYDPVDPTGFPNQRRTIYRMWARGGRSPFLDTFDCPDPSTTAPKRSSTVTPLQALSLLNHSFVLRMADQFAERLKFTVGDSPDAQVITAYRQLFGRKPEADEVAMSTAFVKRRGLPAFCRAMWNSSEFLFVD